MFKYLLPLLCLVCITACSSEEDIKPSIEYTNDFTIADNPADSVQHERYLIYKEFGVPVYFNDTILTRQKGTDAAGNPRLNYERVDLNWTFYGYSQNVKYTYNYLVTDAEKMNSLRFVRAYLQQVSKPMRPFSIMLTDTLRIASTNKEETPLYHVGYRTLVFAQLKKVVSDEQRLSTITEVIHSMIADRIKADREVCARFAEVSSEKGWYYREWKKLDNCPTIAQYQALSWVVTVNGLYDEPPFVAYDHKDIIEVLSDPSLNVDYEDALAARRKMVGEMAAYGFLRGWKSSGQWTPADADEDRQHYIDALLYLGDGGFRRRYGSYAVVMNKYKVLYDFITEKLGVSLDYDNLNDDL